MLLPSSGRDGMCAECQSHGTRRQLTSRRRMAAGVGHVTVAAGVVVAGVAAERLAVVGRLVVRRLLVVHGLLVVHNLLVMNLLRLRRYAACVFV